jgi:hypothetical protein
MEPSSKCDNEIAEKLSKASFPQVDRLVKAKEWLKAKKNLKGEFGVYHLCERMAVIISKTYLERGDEVELADDMALMIIRDLLLALDEQIIERNKDKSLAHLFTRAKPYWVWVTRRSTRR